MLFSQTVEYILRVVVFLATRSDGAATTHDISSATQVPIGYLAKIMQRLVKSKLVISQRGRNGGFELATRAYTLSMYDIVQQLEPIVRIRACPLHKSEHADRLCPLHFRLDQAIAGVEAALQEFTVAQLVQQLTKCDGLTKPGESISAMSA